MKLLQNNPLFSSILLPIIVDVVGTVIGQSKEYWLSHYKIVNEATPLYILLQIHPLLFIIGTLIIWLPITYLLTKKLKEPYNIWATMTLFAAHSYDSVYWVRVTQRNLGIFSNHDRLSITLSLFPMYTFVLIIGYIASRGIIKYYQNN